MMHCLFKFLNIYIFSFSIVFNSSDALVQPTSPIGLEVEVKLGGTQSNLILTRLTPWMGLLALRKKKVVVENGGSTSESPKSSGHKAIMWTCTVSAPEMTIVLYDMSGSPLYHVRFFF